ncbi:MAG: TIGR02391 family protein [Planctomycetes bacterium RBG_13_60_9]|nr:MAG: TIGR02391 family protein [Planctomycetes bacterium RBG_13_60_9]
MSLPDLVEQPELLRALEPEELAGALLRYLVILSSNKRNTLNRDNFCRRFQGKSEETVMAIMEAWVWLEREICIAPLPFSGNSGSVFVTRTGYRLAESCNLPGDMRANLLPKGVLHPVIAQAVWSAFIRGEYTMAVLEAFKQVEVAVREAGHFATSEIGVPLMRKAFHPDSGPLTDNSADPGERQALSDLFAGAIGSYKNPHSHRNVILADRNEALEVIMLASRLLKIVDARTAGLSRDPHASAPPTPT